MFKIFKEQWVKEWFNELKPLEKIVAAIFAPLAVIEGYLEGFVKGLWFGYLQRKRI